MCPRLSAEVQLENQKYLLNKMLFNPNYFEFIEKVLEDQDCSQGGRINQEICRFCLQSALTVIIRYKNNLDLCTRTWLRLRSILAKSPELSLWLVSQFCRVSILTEFFIECPLESSRSLASCLVVQAVRTLAEKTRD